MALTRDAIQGFIDGFLVMGGDRAILRQKVEEWLSKHPAYPHTDAEVNTILDDLESYRGVVAK